MKPIKLKVGDWWQIPSGKEVRLRVITDIKKNGDMFYADAFGLFNSIFAGHCFSEGCSVTHFKCWIKAHGARLIAQVNFGTEKVVVAK